MRAPPGIRTVAGDIGLVVLEVHGSSDEAEVGAPVEHVQVDGRAGFDDGRHRVQDLCREGRLMAERSQALSPWEAPHHSSHGFPEPSRSPWPEARSPVLGFRPLSVPRRVCLGPGCSQGRAPHPPPRGRHPLLTWRT